MKDISILACFGIKTDELENYQIEDLSPSEISLSVTKRRGLAACPCCGDINLHVKDYKKKHYFYRNINGYDIRVFYRQRRYVCPSCGKTFLEQNPFIKNANYCLSSQKIATIIERLKENLSLKLIADYSGVSTTSVIKVLDKYYNPPKRKLPEILCIDEFMAFNSSHDSKYACLLIDFVTGEIIDVIKSRQKKFLYHQFFNLPKEEKLKVRFLIMDMYKQYRDLAKYYLPNAIVAIDPFHYIRYSVNAIDLVRIETMKSFDEDDARYKVLQKYKNLLLRKSEPNDYKRRRIRLLGDQWLTEKEILETLFSYNPKLKRTYDTAHPFLANHSKFNYEEFKRFLSNTISRYKNSGVSKLFEVGETYENWYQEICNSKLVTIEGRNLSNGPIEGTNNKIKALKRVSYGLTNFDHLRKRIFLIFSKTEPHEKS